MKLIGKLFLTVSLAYSSQLSSQPAYLTGTGQSSIEPDQTLISLHLGGYGAPRDGRFSLQWIEKGNVPDATALAGINNRLFIVSGNDILNMMPSESAPVWKSAGKAEKIISLAGLNEKLYAINTAGNLLVTNTQGKIKWSNIGSVNSGATAIAASGNNLFVSDNKGSLWTTDLSKKSIEWTKTEIAANVISLAANKGKLYALTSEDVIYRCELSAGDKKWLKIAYKNNETIREDIKQITFLNDRIFGISRENFLYSGEHRSEGNLTARALAVKNGEQTVIIVNVDVCGLTDSFTGPLKKEIFQKHHLPPSSVFINSSHTHFAPVSQNWLTWQEANQRPDSIFLYSTVRNGILSAIDKAIENLSPADLYFGRGTTDIGYNRSLKDHPELYDSNVDVIKIASSIKRSESYLFLAACHPVFSTAGSLHYTISANYPGVARKLVEERTGTSNSLFLQGTAGDINPKDNGEYITGEKLANEIIGVLKRPMKKIEGTITFFLDTINIPIKPWTNDQILAFRAENADKTGDIYAEKNVKWCDLMLDNYKKGVMPVSLPVYVQTLNIGNWKLVGFSRETTTGYSFGVKNLWPDKLVSVAGYTNDVSSYLPTHMHIEAKGYEGLDSFFWYGMPNVFPENVDDIILSRIKTLSH